MPKITIKAGGDYALKLSKLASGSEAIIKRAIYEGAKVFTDALRKNIQALPEEPEEPTGHRFRGVPPEQKEDILNGLGTTQMRKDKDGWNTKVGFSGYGSHPTRAYPKGLPIPMLMRSIESGSTVRRKIPVIRRTTTAMKGEAEKAMNDSIDKDIKNIMNK